MTSWDASVDFLVIGSGAAGMTAALRAHDMGATTMVVEKAVLFGGSTAISGGVVWVPNNPLMAQHGISDSTDAGLQYLETVTAGTSSTERLRAYVETAPRMMSTLAENSHVRFECVKTYPDYFPEVPGGKSGGRSCEPLVFDALQLGAEFGRMRRMPTERLILGGRLSMRAADGHLMLAGGLPATWFMLRALVRYYTNLRARLQGLRNTNVTLGGALAGRLRLSLMDRAVPLWLNTTLRELLTEGGRVTGACVERDGTLLRIQAKKGVLLATGGFDRNAAMRARYQPAPISDAWSAGCESNTGDSVTLATAVGASLDLMDDSWWCPAMLNPLCPSAPVWVMIFEKNLPASIIVNKRGQRFMNEAAPYNDTGKSMLRANTPDAPAIPAYLIFDSTYRRKYPCGPMNPGYAVSDRSLPKGLEGAFFEKADTLDGLARKIGVDPAGLLATANRVKEFAVTGHDLDFHRGDSLQDRYYTVNADGPNPTLGPLAQPPFYAVKVYPGDLGTKGGVRTDPRARVLTEANDPIPGLYAAGNCSAAVMGRTYPGAGATIGPAMTFGFIAAEHAVGGGREGRK
ncbi:MAG: kstD [Deltaproteobacteria bacterium]|nr:kstD [Deltaproteobacteria bacterium]